MSRPWRNVGLTLLALCALVVFLPGLLDNRLLALNFVVFMILAQGVNILYGFTGYLPFGYSGFFGLGAYGFAVSVMHLPGAGIVGALVASVVLAVVVGALLIPTLRLSGPYFAIANMAVALGLLEIVQNPAMQGITNGPYGVRLTDVFAPSAAYWVAAATLLVSVALVGFLRYSSFGMIVRAMRDDPIAADLSGINIVGVRTIIWLVSAALAGLIGGTFGWYISTFYPVNVFDLNFSLFAIVFTIAGGAGTILGPIIGVLALYGLYNYLGISNPGLFQFAYGAVIMLLVLFLPDGLRGLFKRLGADLI